MGYSYDHRKRTAGHFHETVRGQGYTEQEALRDALSENVTGFADEEYREVLKSKRLRAPKPPRRVKIEKQKLQRGKVERAFVLETRWMSQLERNPGLAGDRQYQERYKTQGAALKAAKEVALKYDVELNIYLAAFCQGDTHLATVTPEAGKPGVWEFVIDFHA